MHDGARGSRGRAREETADEEGETPREKGDNEDKDDEEMKQDDEDEDDSPRQGSGHSQQHSETGTSMTTFMICSPRTM